MTRVEAVRYNTDGNPTEMIETHVGLAFASKLGRGLAPHLLPDVIRALDSVTEAHRRTAVLMDTGGQRLAWERMSASHALLRDALQGRPADYPTVVLRLTVDRAPYAINRALVHTWLFAEEGRRRSLLVVARTIAGAAADPVVRAYGEEIVEAFAIEAFREEYGRDPADAELDSAG